MELGEVLPERL